MLLHSLQEAGSKFASGISCLLLITVFALFLPYSSEGSFEQSRFNTISKTLAQNPDAIKKKATKRLAVVAPNEAQVSLFFDSYPHLLGFDRKQNLRTWPVLSNRLERSPPFFGFL